MVQVAPCSPATIAGRRGNLAAAAVSNAMRTRATSHPCERGAGFLQSVEQPRKPAPPIQKVRRGFAEVCDVRRRTETRRLWCAARLLCGWRRGAEGAATENQATRIGAIGGGAECAPGGRGDRAAVCEASVDGEPDFVPTPVYRFAGSSEDRTPRRQPRQSRLFEHFRLNFSTPNAPVRNSEPAPEPGNPRESIPGLPIEG